MSVDAEDERSNIMPEQFIVPPATNEEVVEVIEEDGIEAAVMDYFDLDNFIDSELAQLLAEARRSIINVYKHLGIRRW